MKIGAFAALTGLSRDTLRFYERQGLLRPGVDTHNGYRDYRPEDRERVMMIRLGQRLGFSLSQIAALADAWEAGQLSAAAKQEELQSRLAQIDAQIAELQTMRRYVSEKLDWLASGEIGLPPSLREAVPPRHRR